MFGPWRIEVKSGSLDSELSTRATDQRWMGDFGSPANSYPVGQSSKYIPSKLGIYWSEVRCGSATECEWIKCALKCVWEYELRVCESASVRVTLDIIVATHWPESAASRLRHREGKASRQRKVWRVKKDPRNRKRDIFIFLFCPLCTHIYCRVILIGLFLFPCNEYQTNRKKRKRKTGRVEDIKADRKAGQQRQEFECKKDKNSVLNVAVFAASCFIC